MAVSNIEYFKERAKFFTRDMVLSDGSVDPNDDQLKTLIQHVFEDICISTRIFKKVFEFRIFPDIRLYDFNEIAAFSESLELETETIDVADDYTNTDLDAKGVLTGAEIPKIEVTVTENIDPYKSTIIGVESINRTDTAGDITHMFKYVGNNKWYVHDETILTGIDKIKGLDCFMVASVIPDIEELNRENRLLFNQCMMEGLKYHAGELQMTTEDTKVSNLAYMRYFNEKNNLTNRFPTIVFGNYNKDYYGSY